VPVRAHGLRRRRQSDANRDTLAAQQPARRLARDVHAALAHKLVRWLPRALALQREGCPFKSELLEWTFHLHGGRAMHGSCKVAIVQCTCHWSTHMDGAELGGRGRPELH
jgi:hypothetical protein